MRLFPDAWFERIARTVGGPIMVIYRALARVIERAIRVFRKHKIDEGKGESESESENGSETLEIKITAANEKVMNATAEDLKKGRA